VGPHQSTEMALDKATSHIIVTHPSCFFWLPPWENKNRSTTLIYSIEWCHLINYSWEKWFYFTYSKLPL